MRKVLMAWMLGMSLGASVGCVLPSYSADPATRTRQLIYSSEDLRQFLQEWERMWMLDMPSHMTPYRTHGGVI